MTDTVSRAEVLAEIGSRLSQAMKDRDELNPSGTFLFTEYDRTVNRYKELMAVIRVLPATPASGVARLRGALERIAGVLATPHSSSAEDRLYAALEALDEVRAVARAALTEQDKD